MAGAVTARLPDFVVIGAMKSGTTSLFRWLDAQPEITMPSVKEPDFFSDDAVWARGLDWYSGLFADVPGTALTGEASVSYSSPGGSERAAPRIAATMPGARIVYAVRHPVERLRSHYRHDVQRSRQRRTLGEALADPANPYAGSSRYASRLRPYLDAFPAEQVCIVRFEDLVEPGGAGFGQVLEHLGLPARPSPGEAHNVTADKVQYTRVMLRLWEGGRLNSVKRVPAPLRRVGKRLLTRRRHSRAETLVASADGPLPAAVLEDLATEAEALNAMAGRVLWGGL